MSSSVHPVVLMMLPRYVNCSTFSTSVSLIVKLICLSGVDCHWVFFVD